MYVGVRPLSSVQQKFSLPERHTADAPPLTVRHVPGPAIAG
jgi:hypothetical protein